MVRQPIVAGRFYAASKDACLAELQGCMASMHEEPPCDSVPCGAIVPHAGWICSGRVTAKVFQTMAGRCRPDCVVLMGAVHSVSGPMAALYPSGQWQTPLGRIDVDDSVAGRLAALTHLVEENPSAHQTEHSLEVQVPFVQFHFPGAKIVPLMVPPSAIAPGIGEAVGEALAEHGGVVVLGTSDLTHYGPSYGMTTRGIGAEGLAWAKNENDRRMIDVILSMDAAAVVPEAARHHNACGSGAIAATIAACKVMGASRAVLLEHTTSSETLAGIRPGRVRDAVGYAGILFEREPAGA